MMGPGTLYTPAPLSPALPQEKKLKFEKAINTFFTEKERIYTPKKAVRYYAQTAYLQTSMQTTSHRV